MKERIKTFFEQLFGHLREQNAWSDSLFNQRVERMVSLIVLEERMRFTKHLQALELDAIPAYLEQCAQETQTALAELDTQAVARGIDR